MNESNDIGTFSLKVYNIVKSYQKISLKMFSHLILATRMHLFHLKKNCTKSHLKFRLAIVDSIVEKYQCSSSTGCPSWHQHHLIYSLPGWRLPEYIKKFAVGAQIPDVKK